MSKKNNIFEQNGGDESVKTWAQDYSPPGSYKIQIGYIEIPKTIKFDEKWVDTPYRFQSFHDANMEADRIFDGYLFRIVGSNDQPYWNAPPYLHQNKNQTGIREDERWYGNVSQKNFPFPLDQEMRSSPRTQYAVSELSKLNDLAQSRNKKNQYNKKPNNLKSNNSTSINKSQIKENNINKKIKEITPNKNPNKSLPIKNQRGGRIAELKVNLKKQ